jgi:hypothetical protein
VFDLSGPIGAMEIKKMDGGGRTGQRAGKGSVCEALPVVTDLTNLPETALVQRVQDTIFFPSHWT